MKSDLIKRFLVNKVQSPLRIYFFPRTMKESFIKNRYTRKFVIVGLSRSGTSLLQQLLNAYPTVMITYESIYQPFIGKNKWEAVHAYYYEVIKQYKHLINSLIINEEWSGKNIKEFSYDIEYDYFGDKLIYNSSRSLRRSLSRAVKNRRADKFIFIVRDPRDRMLSFLKWNKRRNIVYRNTSEKYDDDGNNDSISLRETIQQSILWKRFAIDIKKYCNQTDKCKWIRYEDLVGLPKESIVKIFQFLGLDEEHYPFSILSTVSDKSVDKWKINLDDSVSKEIYTITKEYLNYYGYE